MKVLVMNCSPVRNGETAEIVNIVTGGRLRCVMKTKCINCFLI